MSSEHSLSQSIIAFSAFLLATRYSLLTTFSEMSSFEIKNLHVAIGEKEIVKGLSLTINSGEVHARSLSSTGCTHQRPATCQRSATRRLDRRDWGGERRDRLHVRA